MSATQLVPEKVGSKNGNSAKGGYVIDEAAIERLVIDGMAQDPVAGLAVGVIQDGRLVHFKGYGVADTWARTPITADTVFRIGSISKTFTAVAVMRLVEQGKLGLDDPVNDHFKRVRIDGPDPARPITVRHLLTHRSGIGEIRALKDLWSGPMGGLGHKLGTPVPTLDDYYGDGFDAETAPEEKWAYANHAFALLGKLIEDVTGDQFAQHMRDQVFKPLGMTSTDYERTPAVAGKLATGYSFKKGVLKPVKDLEITVGPAGSIFSSVNDMAKYAAWLTKPELQQSIGIIKPATLAQMITPQFETPRHFNGMGLAYMLEDLGGHRIAQHSGGWPGFISNLYAAVDDNIAWVVFTNTGSVLPVKLSQALARQAFGLADPVEDLARRRVANSSHLWSDLIGVYAPDRGWKTNVRVWGLTGGEFEVFVKAGRLSVRTLVGAARKGLELIPVDADDPLLFAVTMDGAVEHLHFARDEGGEVTYLDGPGFSRMRKRGALRSGRTWAKIAGGAAAVVTAGVLLRRRS